MNYEIYSVTSLDDIGPRPVCFSAESSPKSSSRRDPASPSSWLQSESFCESPKVLIVQELLKFEANPDAMDKEGQTPLHLAIGGGHLVAAKRLLHGGAAPNICDKKVISSKLRQSYQPRFKFQLKLQSNRLLIGFFDPISWNPNQSL